MTIWHITSTDEHGENKTVTEVKVTRVRKGVYVSDLEPGTQCSYEDEAAFFPVLMQLRLPSAATVDGQMVCVVRPRYTSGGVSTVGLPITMGMLRADGLGWWADGGPTLNTTYGVAMRHMVDISHRAKVQFTDGDRDIASRASSRATLAIMKIFGLRCIRNHVKEKAAVETPVEVAVSLSGGPWFPVDGNGDVVE